MSEHGSLGRLDLQQPPELLPGTVESFNPINAALARIAQSGIVLHGLPASGYRGEMPPDITSLDDEALGRYLSDSSQYVGYLDTELAKSEVEMKSSQSALDYVCARVQLTVRMMTKEELGGGRLSEKDKAQMVTTEPRVVEAQKRADYCAAVYRILRAIRDRSQRDWESISRRITQRGQDVQRQIRNQQVAGVPHIGSPRWRPPEGGPRRE